MKGVIELLEELEFVTDVEYLALGRYLVEVEPQRENERFQIELSLVFPDNNNKNSLPNLWKNSGLTDKVLESYICLKTYFTNENGCFGICNPTIKKNSCALDFDWVLEATEENIKKIVGEAIQLYCRFSG